MTASTRAVAGGAAIHAAAWWVAVWTAAWIGDATSEEPSPDALYDVSGILETAVAYVALIIVLELAWTRWLVRRARLGRTTGLALGAGVGLVALLGAPLGFLLPVPWSVAIATVVVFAAPAAATQWALTLAPDRPVPL